MLQMSAMEEKNCSPPSGSHQPPVPMRQPNPLDLTDNSFGLLHHSLLQHHYHQQQQQQQQQQQLKLHRPPVHHLQSPPNIAAAPDAARRPGIPPLPPYSQMHPWSPSSSSSSGSFHARSISQPTVFSFDPLPHLSPLPPAPQAPPTSMQLSSIEAGATVAAEDRLLQQVSRTPTGLSHLEIGGSGSGSDGRLPPRKAHRRSQSDIPFGIAAASSAGFIFQPPPLSPTTISGPLLGPTRSRQQQLVKQEPSDWEKEAESRDHDGGDAGDELISAYMNLDNLEALHSCETEDRREYMNGSRLSGTKTNNTADSSENEAESSSVNDSGGGGGGGDVKEGNKRSAAGDLMPKDFRHLRSLSMDSMMSKLNFVDEPPKFPPSMGHPTGQLSRSSSMDGATASMLNLEFGNGEFNSAELKKIVVNEKLVEMALIDPKRVKRILANRQSAARSKERKMRYISDLEHKVQALQTEATTLSAQLTLLQRDSAGLTSQNNELKFRIKSMEQQAQLRDALNQALNAEVHRLKLSTEITEAQLSKIMNQQMHMNAQGFQLDQLQSQQQSPQASRYQMQMPEQQQQPDNVASMSEEKQC